MQKIEYIEKAVVIVKDNRIIGFAKLKAGEKRKENDIKRDLCSKIPKYMCPKIKIIDKFPLNKNGKCDEKKLLEEN